MKQNTEKDVRAAIRLAIGSRSDCVLFSNPTGTGVVGKVENFKPGAEVTRVFNPRWLSFGLGAKPGGGGGGFPDLIGIQTITIGPEHIGQQIGVFVGLEIKKPGEIARPDQLKKIALLRAHGAKAGTADTIEKAERILDGL